MQVSEIARRVRAGYAPPTERHISSFADEEIMVTAGPLAGTQWRTSIAPFQAGIMDAWHEPGVEIVVVMGSSQWGKTAILVNIVCYHIAEDPSEILVVLPTLDPMAKDFSKNRLDPVIGASPELARRVSKRRAPDASNTLVAKTFLGGDLAIAGAKSAASLAARSRRVLLLDELDRYPPELPGEGNTVQIALKRTQVYRRRRRVMMTSSPTVVGGPIHSWFLRGDQRRFYVPCPACGIMHPYEWRNVKWQRDDPTTARLICPACKHPMTEGERTGVLAQGRWRAEAPDRPEPQIVSFHIWEAYSPFSSLRQIVAAFLQARRDQKAGDQSEMHTWQNTTLGEPIEPERGEGVDTHVVLQRRQGRASPLDPAIACLTLGVDVQDDRLETLLLGWAVGEECWAIDRRQLDGNTEEPEVWQQLDELLEEEWPRQGGGALPIRATCIDSAGHRTTLVYDYVQRRAVRRVFATIGRAGDRPIVSSPTPRKWGRNKRPVPLYTIGVDAAKALWMSRLRVPEAGHGYVHLPAEAWCDDEFAAQLTSERLVTKWQRGIPRSEWRKIRARNETLDCAVLGLAALRLLNPNLERLLEQARTTAAHGGAPPAPKAPPPRRGWVPPNRNWLRPRR